MYALIDCCVANAVSLLVAKLSSSRTVVTLAPEPPNWRPLAVYVPTLLPSTVNVIVPDPSSVTATLVSPDAICVVDTAPTSESM